MSGCTAKVTGIHEPNSQALFDCPVHGTRGSAPGAPGVVAAPPTQKPSRREPPSLRDLSDEDWGSAIHTVGTQHGIDDSVLEMDRFEWAADEIKRQREANEGRSVRDTISHEEFSRRAAAGQTVFADLEINGDMSAVDTNGMVFDGCLFHGNVVTGDRCIMHNSTVRGDLMDSSLDAKHGGRADAILDYVRVGGSLSLSGSSFVAANYLEVAGDIRATSGNNLQAVFLTNCRAEGVIIIDDADSIVVCNNEDGNVIAWLGAEESRASHGTYGEGARYSGMEVGDNGPEDEDEYGPSVRFVTYDDLQEFGVAYGQGELGKDSTEPDYAEMDQRVIAKARAMRQEDVAKAGLARAGFGE